MSDKSNIPQTREAVAYALMERILMANGKTFYTSFGTDKYPTRDEILNAYADALHTVETATVRSPTKS